jgi:hypothetical protein
MVVVSAAGPKNTICLDRGLLKDFRRIYAHYVVNPMKFVECVGGLQSTHVMKF